MSRLIISHAALRRYGCANRTARQSRESWLFPIHVQGLRFMPVAGCMCFFRGGAEPDRFSARAATHPEVHDARLQAITHVTVINPGSGAEERRDMTILYRDSTILTVENSAEAHLPPGTVIHDEHGRYVMPGLWDTHVHLLQVGPKAFPLFLANGITSVRDMGSDLIEIRQWQEARSHGALIPRILTPGPKLDGMSYDESLEAGYRPDRYIVTSPETARAIVDVLLSAHVDFIKVHNGMTPAI